MQTNAERTREAFSKFGGEGSQGRWGLGAALVIAAALACATADAREAPRRSDLAGKTYVVTGCSSGFGKGVAFRLGERGANVVMGDIRAGLQEPVAREIRARGGSAISVQVDVASAEAMQRLGRVAVARYGRIDVWINNAGVGVISRFEDAPARDYSRLVDINYKGVIYGSQVAIRQFKRQGAGTLVNMGRSTAKCRSPTRPRIRERKRRCWVWVAR